jgi:alpha-beta hydrolase superfamily lysophospholipase
MIELPDRNDPMRADAGIPRREFSLEIPDRGRLAGIQWNPAGASGLVAIIHGLGDHADRYGRAVRALVERDFAVETLDLPGHGKSYGARGHVESWDEYRNAMEAWRLRPREHGGSPIAVVGHSMGALLALEWALRHPEELRGIVLSAPPFEVVLRATMLKVRLAQLIVRLWPGFSQRTTILPSMLSHDPDVVRAHNEDPLVHYLMSARLFFEFRAVNAALRQSAPKLTVPALVLHGTGDLISSPLGSERWAKAARPGMVDLRLYKGLYHEILNEPEGPRIAEELASWLARQSSR